jgi:hypothetical protein
MATVGGRDVSYGGSVMMARRTLQLVFTRAFLSSFGSCSGLCTGPATSIDAPTRASNWPEPVKDNQILNFVTFDELEGRTNGPNCSLRWHGQGWIGTDLNKLWIKSEGIVTNGMSSNGDHEVLYDSPIRTCVTSMGSGACFWVRNRIPRSWNRDIQPMNG